MSDSKSLGPQVHCSHRPRPAISLPLLATDAHGHGGGVRPSKSGRRRAIVLVTVQLLMIAHVAIWALSRKYGWFGGKTISPIEPSESMQFSQQGLVNAGLVFFSLALLGTLVMGRWFCGWGCHIVMLQDFCGWIMKKCGVRPHAFRSRLLMYVPLLLALYMFVMPAVYRWGMVPLDARLAAKMGEDNRLVHSWRNVSTLAGFPLPNARLAPWQARAELVTADFWKTFAGVAVAIPFLFVCGFGIVYFLGAKGFCTYGCPYGGFFAPLDKLAVGRIIVTDACEHCGHCTSVCTSNVRVHEEVREYGMVVDPGCMKCLDCVSVCPNDALYFGFAKPSILKGAAKSQPPRRHYDLTWPEEIAFSAVFLLSFLAWRGAYGLVPMLMAAGMAGIITFVAWKLWRMARDGSVTLHRFQLKFKGSIRPAGWAFGLLVAGTLVLTAHSGAVNAAWNMGQMYDARVTVPPQYIYGLDRVQISPAMAENAQQALKWYDRASKWGGGGFGPTRAWQQKIDLQRGWLYAAQLEFDRAEDLFRQSLATLGDDQMIAGSLALAMRGQGKSDEAVELYKAVLGRHVEYEGMAEDFTSWSMYEGDPLRVIPFLRQQLQSHPDHLHTMRLLSKALIQSGQFAEGVTLVKRTIEIDPDNPWAYYFLAAGLANLNRTDEAIAAMGEALKRSPDEIAFNSMMANLLDAAGRNTEASTFRLQADRRQQELNAQLQAQQQRPPSP